MYRVLGEMLNPSPENLVEKLRILYPNIKHRPRVFGHDIELEQDGLELTINTYDGKEYNIDALLDCETEDLIVFLNNLKHQFVSLNVAFDLTYFEEDEDGEQISPDTLFWKNTLED